MARDLDQLLSQLRSHDWGEDLSGLEAAVSSRIARERMNLGAPSGWKLQVAVVCTSLLLGLAVADFGGYTAMRQTMLSELIVLSDDGALAPSIRLGGSM